MAKSRCECALINLVGRCDDCADREALSDRSTSPGIDALPVWAQLEIRGLRAENERLREALADVINHWVLSDAPEQAVIDRAVEALDLSDPSDESSGLLRLVGLRREPRHRRMGLHDGVVTWLSSLYRNWSDR